MTQGQLRFVRWSLFLIFVGFGAWVASHLYESFSSSQGGESLPTRAGDDPVSREVVITQLDSEGEVVSTLRAAESVGRTESGQVFRDVEIEFSAGRDDTPILVTADKCVLQADSAIFLSGSVVVEDDTDLRLETETLTFRKGPDRIWSEDSVRYFKGASNGWSGSMLYYVKRGNIELQDGVWMTLHERGDAPTRIKSQRASMKRKQERLRFVDDVIVRQEARSLKANDLVVFLRNNNEQIEHVEAYENVELLFEVAPDESFDSEFERGPETTRVTTPDEGAPPPSGGGASTDSDIEDNNDDAAPIQEVSVHEPGRKQLLTDRLEILYQDENDKLKRVRALDGGQLIFTPPPQEEGYRRVLDGNLLAFDFDELGRMTTLRSRGGVTLTMTPTSSEGPERVLRARQLDGHFNPETGEMLDAQCSKQVEFEQGELRATADEGRFDMAADELTLEVDPELWDNRGKLEAETIVIQAGTGIVEGLGRVRATSKEDDSNSLFPSASEDQEPVFFVADRLHYESSRDTAVYTGSARAFRGENRIEADRIELKSAEGELGAAGSVRTVFTQTVRAATDPQKPLEPSRTVTLAERFSYRTDEKMMRYRRNVEMNSADLRVKGHRLDLKLSPGGREVEEVEVNEDVEIHTDEADAEGDFAKYIPESDEMLVTGETARLQNGDKVTEGKQLTFYLSNDKVLVDGQEQNRTKTTYSSKPRPF